MSNSIQLFIFDIPDEILEDNLFTLLSFNDLISLMKIGNTRIFRCCDAVIRKKPFGKGLSLPLRCRCLLEFGIITISNYIER